MSGVKEETKKVRLCLYVCVCACVCVCVCVCVCGLYVCTQSLRGLQVPFTVTPQSVDNAKDRSRLPDFLVEGELDSCTCSITSPLQGVVSCLCGVV